MGKGLKKVFKTAVKDIFQDLPPWDNMVQRFTISFQNLETLLKLQNCQMTQRNLGLRKLLRIPKT